MKNHDFVTLILAGGRGNRLGLLTKETAKPAVIFGGAYHLIDFTLTNCKYSHAGDIGVITQYCQTGLADYIGPGSEWLPENEHSSITILPPRIRNAAPELYEGTADAILKNADFIEEHNAKSVLVLSGDHVYKMDYAKILDAHKGSGAAATIAAATVPYSEAPRFGIIDVDCYSRITDFEEKPLHPASDLASMGVYVFDWATLKKYLCRAANDANSGMDIGRDIIPAMLLRREELVAYHFDGYWRDIGTAYNLWEANMDLLSASSGMSLNDGAWRIMNRDHEELQYIRQYYQDGGRIFNSLISGSYINKGTILKSVISADVTVGDDAGISYSVVMPGAKIGKGAFVFKAVIGSNAIVEDYTVLINAKPDGVYLDNCQGISVVGNNASVYTNNGWLPDCAALPQPEAAVVI